MSQIVRLGPGRQAALGLATWAGWVLGLRPSWAACLLLFSPFVLVPLGLGIAGRATSGPLTPSLPLLTPMGWPAAVLAAASFALNPGLGATALTLPWLAFGLTAAVIAAGRFLSRPSLHPTVGVDGGLVFLAVGAAWLTISRAGLNPLGFDDAIVQLTAVHFHYAGFALPLVAGAAAGHLRRSVAVPLLVLAGVPLTAIGITVGGTTEWLAATVMASGGLVVALLLVCCGLLSRRAARALLMTSGMALAAGMTLALAWAWSEQFGWRFLDLDQMARYHGSLNALGFGLLALAGLHHLPRSDDAGARRMVVHPGRLDPGSLGALARSAAGEPPTSPVGILSGPLPAGYRWGRWSCALPAGFDAGCDALRHWAGQRAAGIDISEPPPPLAVGHTLALAIPVGPMSISATCRIVEVIDEPDRFGFTYATLPHHPEDGEESFIIDRDPDGNAHYTVTAMWRPGLFVTRVVPPLTRFFQERAINRYLTGVAAWSPAGRPSNGNEVRR